MTVAALPEATPGLHALAAGILALGIGAAAAVR
jgi:hypothetical protein